MFFLCKFFMYAAIVINLFFAVLSKQNKQSQSSEEYELTILKEFAAKQLIEDVQEEYNYFSLEKGNQKSRPLLQEIDNESYLVIDPESVLVYTFPEMLPPTHSIEIRLSLKTKVPQKLHENVRILFNQQTQGIDTKAQIIQDRMIMKVQYTDFSSQILRVYFYNIKNETVLLENFKIQGVLCHPFCLSCQQKPLVCSSCSKGAELIFDACRCQSETIPSIIQPLSCEPANPNFMSLSLCYLETSHFLAKSDITSHVDSSPFLKIKGQLQMKNKLAISEDCASLSPIKGTVLISRGNTESLYKLNLEYKEGGLAFQSEQIQSNYSQIDSILVNFYYKNQQPPELDQLLLRSHNLILSESPDNKNGEEL